jgi:hypothetical protein
LVGEEEEKEVEVHEFTETPTKVRLTIPVRVLVEDVETLTSATFEFQSHHRHFDRQLTRLMLQLGTLMAIVGPALTDPHA